MVWIVIPTEAFIDWFAKINFEMGGVQQPDHLLGLFDNKNQYIGALNNFVYSLLKQRCKRSKLFRSMTHSAHVANPDCIMSDCSDIPTRFTSMLLQERVGLMNLLPVPSLETALCKGQAEGYSPTGPSHHSHHSSCYHTLHAVQCVGFRQHQQNLHPTCLSRGMLPGIKISTGFNENRAGGMLRVTDLTCIDVSLHVIVRFTDLPANSATSSVMEEFFHIM